MHREPVIVDRRISFRIPTSPLTATRGLKKGVHDGGQTECSRNFIRKYVATIAETSITARLRRLPTLAVFWPRHPHLNVGVGNLPDVPGKRD